MIKCYCAANLLEAHIIQDLLEQAGIKTHVFNENAQGGVGEIPFIHAYPELWVVKESDLKKAREIIKDYESPAAESPNQQCKQCGELNPGSFQICWSCGQEVQQVDL